MTVLGIFLTSNTGPRLAAKIALGLDICYRLGDDAGAVWERVTDEGGGIFPRHVTEITVEVRLVGVAAGGGEIGEGGHAPRPQQRVGALEAHHPCDRLRRHPDLAFEQRR